MSEHVFSIAEQFGKYAGPRYKKQGPHSGESLRGVLVKFLDANTGVVTIVLDGTRGMGSSFLDEAFGGLVRKEGKSRNDLMRRLRFQSRIDPSYIETILDSIERAVPEGQLVH
jgi:hypothetical protein